MYRTTQIDNRAQHYDRMEVAAQQDDEDAKLRLAWLSRQKSVYTKDGFNRVRAA